MGFSKKYIENRFPEWIDNIGQHDLVLSDDIDSLASCCALQQVYGMEITNFYNFNALYTNGWDCNEKLWVDIAVKNGHSIDNHVSDIDGYNYNKDAINLNAFEKISTWQYQFKYSGSTLLQVWALLDLPLPKTREGKMILLAIDGSYKGFCTKGFRATQVSYMKTMGMPGLVDFLRENHNKDDYRAVVDRYKLNSKITIDEYGMLHTEMDLETIGNLLGIELVLPGDSYFCSQRYIQKTKNFNKYQTFTVDDIEKNVFSFSLTYKNSAKYSVAC